MVWRAKRRSLLKRLSSVALLGPMSIAAAKAGKVPKPDQSERLQVHLPERIKTGQPFSLQIVVPKLNCVGEETRWVELWLDEKYLGRWELTGLAHATTLSITLSLDCSATLRVRDFYGRVLIKRLRVG